VDDRTRAALDTLTRHLARISEIEAVWAGGSLATGDYFPGVSDLDLVALTRGSVPAHVVAQIAALHADLDSNVAAGLSLGCQYTDPAGLSDPTRLCPTWTHGRLIHRGVSLVTRVELAEHGFALAGPSPSEVLPPETRTMAAQAGRQELLGYWSWAARHPGMFWRLPVMVDLGLTAMARGRHAMRHGRLLTKSSAIEASNAPEWLKDQMRARRRGEPVTSPRWRSAYLAWRDVRRTTAMAAKAGPDPQL
jgi:hypothetical protein